MIDYLLDAAIILLVLACGAFAAAAGLMRKK
jgi:hypothetical protein